jgi:LPS-assembly protein
MYLAALLLPLGFAQDAVSQRGSLKKQLLGEDKSPWHISAKRVSYKADEGVYEAEGDVVITKGGQSLHAQKAVYNERQGIARVWGDVRLESGGDVLSGTEGFFDLRNQTGKIKKCSLFLRQNHYYITGEVLEKLTGDTYLITDCHVTTCDGVHPAWSITGSEVKVTIEGYGQVKHAAFRVRGLPIFYVPYMIFPAKTKRQSGLLPPRLGYSSRNGADVELPLFWAISDQTDATFYQRLMSQRGYMQGMEFRYLSREDSRGILLMDILQDRKEKDLNDPEGLELSPFPRTNDTRYWLKGKADQDLSLGIKGRLDVDVVSDQDYLKEFETGLFGFEGRENLAEEMGRPVEDKRSPTRRSALRLSRDAEDYSLQALTSYYQRPEHPSQDRTPQTLGALRFNLLPKKIWGVPLSFGLDTDYDYVWRDVGVKGHRFSVSPDLGIPMWLGRYMEFEPSFSYTYTGQWFDADEGSSDHQSKTAYEARVRVLSNLERTYDIRWQGATRLKHRVWPSLTYTYRVSQGEEEDSPWFEPVDAKGRINQVAFSVENFLDARLENNKGDVSYRQWGYLKLTQGYNMDEAGDSDEPVRKQRPFAPLAGELVLRPFSNLDVFGVAEWDHYDAAVTLADVSLEISLDRSAGRRDRLRLEYQYEKDTLESLDLWLDVNLAYGFSAGSSLQRAINQSHTISTRYWLAYQSQCWAVKFMAEDEEAGQRVWVVFHLTGLGGTGNW